MSARSEGLLFVGMLIVMSFIFQLQLKILADEVAPILARNDIPASSKAVALFWEAIAWRPLLIAVLAAGLFCTWFLALTRLELSVALPIASIALVINAIGSGLMLGEGLNATRIAGVVTVAVGIALVLKS